MTFKLSFEVATALGAAEVGAQLGATAYNLLNSTPSIVTANVNDSGNSASPRVAGKNDDGSGSSNQSPSGPDGPKSDKTYQTYTKTNQETGQIYSGRTSGDGKPLQNIANRDSNHHMSDKGFGAAKLDKSSTNPSAIRGREQQLIQQNGGAQSQGGTSGNAINGISPTNKNLGTYIEAATKAFGK